MDRADIPLWPINDPGTYETRDGRATEVVGKFSDGYWVGVAYGNLMTWSEDGLCSAIAFYEPTGDIIGPWIEGGLPFDKILPAGNRDPELLRRFKDAAAAGVKIECALQEKVFDETWEESDDEIWEVSDRPAWRRNLVYRLHGSIADIICTPASVEKPDQSPAPLNEQRVCEIVAAAFEKFATPVSLKAVASWLRNGMKD